MATRKREKVNANRDLFALGMADVGSAFIGGYPVTVGPNVMQTKFSSPRGNF